MENSPSILKRALRGFSVSVLFRAARLIINLVLTSFLARYIGQTGFGHLMVAMALVGVLLCIVELGMQGILQRELVHEAGELETLGSAFYTRLLLGAACYVGVLFYAISIHSEQKYLLIVYGSLLLTHTFTVFPGWLLAKHHMEAVAWAQLWGFLVSAAAVVAGLVFGAPLWFFALTYVLECWAVMSIVGVMYWSRGGSFKSWKWSLRRTAGLLRESWFELASQLALLLLFRLDTLMVQALRGPADAGVYGAAVRVSEVVYFLPATLGTACLSALVGLRKRDPQRYQRRLTEYFALTLAGSTACAVSLALAAPPLVSVLFGKDFTACAPILMIHAWSFIPYAIGTMRTVYFTVESKLWMNLPSVMAAILLNALLNWWWIPAYSGLGAAWATLIAYTVAWVLSSFVLPGGREIPRLMWDGVKLLPAMAAKALELKTLRAVAASRGKD